MDFSSLPDNTFLHIFHYLPLRDQIKVCGVSVAFRRMSDFAISEMKSLDLNDVALRKVSPLCFTRLLDLCKGGLRKCNLVGSLGRGRQYHQAMANAFNQYTYPQLNTLGFFDFHDSVIDISLRKYASSLESLSVEHAIIFPGVIMERLETLDFCCDDRTMASFVGKMPNLRHLNVRDNGVSHRMLDSFLGTVPLLESLHIRLVYYRPRPDLPLDLEGNGMTAFWQLKSLHRFEVSYGYLCSSTEKEVIIGDNALMRIAESFPRLSVLSLYKVRSGNNGVAALSALRDLRELSLEKVHVNIDAGLLELSKCECLEKLVVSESTHFGDFNYFSAATAATLLRWCPRLSFIACGQLAGASINTRENAVDFITSLAVLEKRVITLRLDFRVYSYFMRSIWRSSEVKDAVKKLEEEAGVVVNILLPTSW